MIKKAIASVLGRLGYEITRKERGGFHAAYLSKICSPKTVFDVGVGRGTPELYGAYPGAKFILVEPLSEFGPALEKLARQLDCVVCRKAVGEKAGTLTINIENDPQGSSLCDRPRADSPAKTRAVEVTTLDAIFAGNPGLASPVLIKIDVEGFELQVLKGARELLKVSEMVIVETSIAKRFEGGTVLEDVIEFMRAGGFRVFDFLTITRREGAPGAHMVDVVFRKK